MKRERERESKRVFFINFLLEIKLSGWNFIHSLRMYLEHCSMKSFFFFCHLEKILEFCIFCAFVWVGLKGFLGFILMER